MSDVHDRLAALDPAVRQPYQHRDLESLISRVVASPAVTKRRFWQRLQLTLATSLIAGALVTAGTLALVEGSPVALPALALKSSNATSSPSVATLRVAGPMQPNASLDFSAATLPPRTTLTAASYQLAIPANAANEASHIARVFGVNGTPVRSSVDPGVWTVTDATGATISYHDVGVPQWTYSAAPSVSGVNSALGALPTKGTLQRDAMGFLAKLGYGYGATVPSFGTTTSTSTNTKVANSTADVAYTVEVAGINTDQSLSFSLNASNVLESAFGPAFRFATSRDYPLQSPRAAVNALNAQRAPSAATANLPIEHVALTSTSLTLKTYELTDGTTWMLPVYVFNGVRTNPNGTSSSSAHASGTWYEIALEPRYLQSGSSASTGTNPTSVRY